MGGLPAQQTLPITGEKQHQVLRNVLDNLTNVMNGYCLPEPYFSSKVGAQGEEHPQLLAIHVPCKICTALGLLGFITSAPCR